MDNALIESRFAAYKAEGDQASIAWAPVLNKIDESRAKKGETPMDAYTRRNTAMCLENAAMNEAASKQGGLLNETTDGSSISFLSLQLPVIAAIVPSLALSEVATVQALDRRSAAVFYLNAKYGTTKDGLTAGNTFIDAKTGHGRSAASRQYGSQLSSQNVGTNGASTVSATLANKPVVPGTVKITDGYEVWSDTGVQGATTGTLVSNASGYTAGAIDYTTGVISLTWTIGYAKAQPVATYGYFYQNMTAGIGTGNQIMAVDFNIVSESVTAVDYILQTKFTMAAALDMKKAHGLDLESEAVRILGNELKYEIDARGFDDMYVAANDAYNGAGAATTFTATPGSGQEFVWRKYQFLDQVEEASNLIFNKTLRASATFMVVGNNAARLIKQLKHDFVPANVGVTPTGPHVIGKLGGRIVVQNPFYPTNAVVYGFKGDSYLQSSFLYCPYIPLMATPSISLADMTVQKAFLSSAANKITLPGAFAMGSIVI